MALNIPQFDKRSEYSLRSVFTNFAQINAYKRLFLYHHYV